jgi:hypothetical protein
VIDYASLAETSAELINEFGQSATVRHVVSIAYDPGLTITVDATGKTFTRSSGSWITDGFLAGDSITFAGCSAGGNNGAKIASNVAALILTCSTAMGLVDVTDAADVTASANQDYTCDVLELDTTSSWVTALMQGSIISETSRFYMLSGATPKINDKLIIGATEYVIDAARLLSPGDTAIYWTVRVKS